MTDLELQGKAALVTGASSGIGAGIAVALAGAGAAVALVGRNRERLDDVWLQAKGVGGTGCIISAEIREEEAPTQIVGEAVRSLGGIDVLVHSAGVYERVAFEKTSSSSLDRQWAVNVRAPFRLTRAALPHLRKSQGSVIFISSVAGRVGLPDRVAYCATKGAVELMMKALAVELSPQGIRVNAVSPGFIATPMNERLRKDPDVVAHTIAATPAGRIGTVADVVPAVLFLASDQAQFVCGQSLGVDGGYPMQRASSYTNDD